MDALGKRGLRLLFCGAALAAFPALAQTPGLTPEWHYSEGHLLDAYAHDELPKWDRVVGLATSVESKYEGGDAYKASAGPTFDIRYRDIAFASAGEGFGLNLLHTKTARAGFALVYDLGRDEDSDHFLTGMGDISPAPAVKVFAEYLLFPVTARIDLRHYFGGPGGYAGDLSLYMPLGGKENSFFVFAGPSMTFGDADYLRHSFGVSPKQSALSGYSEHALGAGVRSYSFGVSGGVFLSKHWIWEGFVAGEKLVAGACSAPFVQQCGQFNFSTTVAYRW